MKFQVGEFNNDLAKINDLIAAILKDLQKSAPEIGLAESGIDWLNQSIEPYQLLHNVNNYNKLDNKSQALIKEIEKTYEIQSINVLTTEKLRQLSGTDQGIRLKRAILEAVYPLKVSKSHFYVWPLLN